MVEDPSPASQEAPLTSQGVEVRPFEGCDHAQVVALWSEVFADDPPWNEPSEMIRRKLAIQPQLFLVAHLDGRVVGTVLAGFDGVRGWIHHLAVLPRHRRRGIATALVRAAERGLREMGCPKINLQVRAGNDSVIAFYRALDYQVEDRTSLGKRLDPV
jgi:ribosomal protein S18 acetylase RimI-like enzyme